MGFRNALRVVQKVMSIGEKLRKSVICFLCVRSRDRRERTAGRRNAEDRRLASVRSEDDRTVAVPRTTAARRSVCEKLHGSAINVYPLQFSFGEEANRLAIR